MRRANRLVSLTPLQAGVAILDADTDFTLEKTMLQRCVQGFLGTAFIQCPAARPPAYKEPASLRPSMHNS